MDANKLDAAKIEAGKKPQVIIVIGMAGSGKTTFNKRLHERLALRKAVCYGINLDPAVKEVSFPVHIDIRDTVDYKKVMQQYKLGPNGAIMTSLNLFSTRIDKVLDLLEKRAPELDYILIDTPGQIEVFNWSASGQIILDSLAVSFPTTAVYIVDTVRCQRPISFMSNMLYACSVLYKTRLPFVVCFNKIDAASPDRLKTWMGDYDELCKACAEDESYMSSLSRSIGLTLIEFYRGLNCASISSVTGEGFEDLFETFGSAKQEYLNDFLPWFETQKEHIKTRREKEAKEAKDKNYEQFLRDARKVDRSKETE